MRYKKSFGPLNQHINNQKDAPQRDTLNLNNIKMSPFLIAALLVFILVFFSTVKVVQEKSAKIVQRFGSFSRIMHPGINFCIPFVESIAGTVSLKVQQLDIHIETKTKDDVFVKLQVSVHVQIMKNRVREAFYELDDPYSQISSYIFNILLLFY